MNPSRTLRASALALAVLGTHAHADENLFGYARGSETLPQGSFELYQFVTHRSDKGEGTYRATDYRPSWSTA